MTTHLMRAAFRLLSEEEDGDGHSEFGVHIQYEDLYDSVLFLICIYVSGQIASRLLQMPSLVGEIFCGILLGPPLADYVPNPEMWVTLGEIGLILLVLEAGIDIDVSTLKLIGTRGCLIAIVGSVLPIGLGIGLAFGFGSDVKSALAAGASFGPTSLGIALNILRGGGILNTPVGQLIVSAAVIDDMIALIVLSQLESLTSEITVGAVLIPVVSALLFLCVGGYAALYIAPGILEKYVLSKTDPAHHGKLELAIMFGFLVVMMPATYYAKASYLMGAFVSGLAFCTSHELHHTFVSQFKRLMQWLMRIFFAASIGFQVPIKDFADGTVIWQGLVFTLALLGKLAVGFMVPNFTQSRNFTGFHLRDCLITGFSMAAEGEFAFVIAVYAVDNGLIDKDVYASVVLAVLLSTIIPPFLLRFTISYYNKKAAETVRILANAEMELNHDLEADDPALSHLSSEERQKRLESDIQKDRAVFLCIQTQSESRWGLMHSLMGAMAKLGLDVIDHRSWHPRGISTTLVNEVYCKDTIAVTKKGSSQTVLEERLVKISEELRAAMRQPEAKINVQRWFPGVVEEIIESVHEKSTIKGKKNLNLEQRLLEEAASKLDRKQDLQTHATQEKTVDEILAGMSSSQLQEQPDLGAKPEALGERRARRRRQKMRSTPVVGGGLFGESHDNEEREHDAPLAGDLKDRKSKVKFKSPFDFGTRGHKAEIIVDGETYDIRINDETLKGLRTGFSGDMLDSRGVAMSSGMSIAPSGNVTTLLQGYVRNAGGLGKIMEETDDAASSETGSNVPHGQLPPV